jgi:predicted TPR repeat methyltransferase
MLATERTAAGRFPPGHSGNPAGRPPGSRNKSTLAVEDALAARAEELVKLLLRSAWEGKGTALRICFDRIAPLRKGRPVPFELPPLACQDDVVAAASAIVMGMADGELTPQEAQDIFKVVEAFQKVLTSPARRERAPSVAAEASRQPRGPAETCKSPGFAAAAAEENAEALDPAPTSPVTPDPPPPAAAEVGSQPPAPSEACKSSDSDTSAGEEDAETLGSVPTSPATPDPAPPVAAEASPPPPARAETCKSPESEAGADEGNAEALDPVTTSAATPDAAPPVAAEASAPPPTPAETCNSAGSADEASDGKDAGHNAASKPTGSSGGALATGTERTAGTADPPPDRPMPARTPLFTSSGDLIADRRYDRARQYEEAGDLPAAAELVLQALEIAPDFACAWFRLGDILEKLEDPPGAIAAFRQALEADRGDRHGAALRLVRLGISVAGEPMSQDYVRALFDQYAPRFDAELVGGLGYRGPQLLRRAVESVAGAGVRFERMVDLGCGTGLAAEAFAPLCRTAVGIDLSPGMIEIARRKGLYVDLAIADMTERLTREPSSSVDLVVAADAFVYLADLAPVCRQAARVLVPRGLLAFSVETHPGPGVILGGTLRFAHGAGHVCSALEAAGLGSRMINPTSVRHEGGIAVPGLIVVAAPARPPQSWAGRGVPRRRG